MARGRSRPQRWAAAVGRAQAALSAIDSAYGELEEALGGLREIQEEYSEWRDGLPENLSASVLGEKLEAICDLDIADDPREISYSDLEELVDEAESIDLPLGFGRD